MAIELMLLRARISDQHQEQRHRGLDAPQYGDPPDLQDMAWRVAPILA
jgi:hypothetical protein